MDKVALVIIVTAVAGGVGAGAGIYHFAGQRAPMGNGALELEITDAAGAPRDTFPPGGQVRWTITLFNPGPGPAVYQGSSCVAYATPYDSNRDAMDGVACPSDYVRREFPAGRTEISRGEWDQVCRWNCSDQQMNKPVPPGDYFLWAWAAGTVDGKETRVEVWFRIA